MTTEGGRAMAPATQQLTNSWEVALSKLHEWDPAWAEQCEKMLTDSWTKGILPIKFIELLCVGLSSAHANIDPEETRRHIQAALKAGASRQEILFVLKCAAVLSIRSFSFNAPGLLQEASVGSLEDFGTARKKRLQKLGEETPAVQKIKALGHWNEDWDSLLFLDPVWMEEYMAMLAALYEKSEFSPKELELLIIALEAAYGNMYGLGTRHHIKSAFRAGATIDEVMEVLKLSVVQGVRARNLAVPILSEELDRHAASQNAKP